METNNDISTKVAMTLNEGKWANMHELSRRVYDTDGIAPTMHTNGGGNQEPKILCSRRTAEGKQLRKDGIERFADRQLEPKDDGTSNAITTVQKDNLLMEPVVLGWSRSSSENGEIIHRHPVEVANTVTAGKRENTQNYVVEPQIASLRGRSQGDWHETEHQQRMEVRTDGNTNSLTSVAKDNMVVNNTRIRKLTERECFRLMGVADKDIDILQASGISRTQQYKLAGNSIVVDVLCAIFDKMFLHTQSDDAQLKLF